MDLLSPWAEVATRRVTYSWDQTAEAAYINRWRDNQSAGLAGPVVSVVMPVRNRPAELAVAVESVRNQSLADWELIIVDDGSDDVATAVEVDHLARSDARIRAVHEPPLGVSAARNVGLGVATGEYQAFLDSDNTWTPDFLKVCTSVMQQRGLRASYAVVAESGDGRIRYRTFEGGVEELLQANFIDLNALVVRRDLLDLVGGFDTSLRRMVDYDLVLRMAAFETPALLPFVGVEYSAASTAPRISTTEALGWENVVRLRQLLDWTAISADLPGVRVVVPVGENWGAGLDTVRSVIGALAGEQVNVVVVHDDGCRSSWLLLRAALTDRPNINVIRTPVRLGRAGAISFALAHGSGDVVCVAPAGTRWSANLTRDVQRARGDRICLIGDDLGACALVAPVAEFVELRGFDPVFVSEFETADLARRLALGGREVGRLSDQPSASPQIWRPDARSHADNLREWRRRWGNLPEGARP